MKFNIQRGWMALGLAALYTVIGCSSASSPAGQKTPNGSGNTPANAPVTAEAAPPTAAGPVTPVSLKEAVAVLDLTQFPDVPGAARQERTSTTASFSRSNVQASDVAPSIDLVRKFLHERGWKDFPQGGSTGPEAWGAQLFFEKQGLVVMVSIGLSRGSAENTNDLNAVLLHVGNVDVRTLPRPPGAEAKSGTFSMEQLFSKLSRGELRKFLQTELTAKGWLEFRSPELPGVEYTEEMLTSAQYFVQRGVKLEYHFSEEAGQTRAICRTELLKREFPMPVGSTEIQLQEEPYYLFLRVPMKTKADMLAYYEAALKPQGYTITPRPAAEERLTEMYDLSADKQPKLSLGFLSTTAETFVEFKQQ